MSESTIETTAATTAAASRPDVYARVTGQIIAHLEAGVRPWQRPWTAGGAAVRPLRSNGTPYRGVNVLTLWLAAAEAGYPSPFWFTFRQAEELGGHVRKGERGALVVYSNTVTKAEPTEDEVAAEREVFILKGYTVFNACQVEGLLDWLSGPLPARFSPADRLGAADAYFQSAGVDLRHGGDRAFYAPAADYVRLPPFAAFRDAESYYATLAHEATHWTGHQSRLARDMSGKFGEDEAYAREELVAEIGAAFLCADLRLALEPREDHAAYLDAWLRILKEDKRAVFKAAAAAQKAVDFLHALQPRGQG